MTSLDVDAIRAEVNYRHEHARASWPTGSTTTLRGAAIRLWTTIRRWMHSRRGHQRTAQNLRQTHHHDKDAYPMTVNTTAAQEDGALIRGIVADIEQGFNDNDPELLARHIADDGLVINPLGTVMQGPLAVEESARELLIGGSLAGATAHYRLTEISLLAPDVAVAHKSAWATAADADDGAPPQMIALYVFIHRDGRWWISRRQNTEVR